mgnify:CR=1 FL=1
MQPGISTAELSSKPGSHGLQLNDRAIVCEAIQPLHTRSKLYERHELGDTVPERCNQYRLISVGKLP